MAEIDGGKGRLFAIPRGAREARLLDRLAVAHDDGDEARQITAADCESRQGLRIIDKLRLDDVYREVTRDVRECGGADVRMSGGDEPVVEDTRLAFLNEARDRILALHLFRARRRFWRRDIYDWSVDAEPSHNVKPDTGRFGEAPLPLFMSLTESGAIEYLNFLQGEGFAPVRVARRYAKGKDGFAETLPWRTSERVSLDMDRWLQDDDMAPILLLYSRDPEAAEAIFAGVEKIPRGGIAKSLQVLLGFGYRPAEMAEWVAEYGNGGLAALGVLSCLLLKSPEKGREARRGMEEVAKLVGEAGKKSALPPEEVAEQAANIFFDRPAEKIAGIAKATTFTGYDPALYWQILDGYLEPVRFCKAPEKEGETPAPCVNLFERIRPLRDAGWSDAEIYRALAGVGYLSYAAYGVYQGSFTRGTGDALRESIILQRLVGTNGEAMIGTVRTYRETAPYVMELLTVIHPEVTATDVMEANASLTDGFVRDLRDSGVPEDLIKEVFYQALDVLERQAAGLENHAAWATQDATFRRIEAETGMTRAEVERHVMQFLRVIVWEGGKAPW